MRVQYRYVNLYSIFLVVWIIATITTVTLFDFLLRFFEILVANEVLVEGREKECAKYDGEEKTNHDLGERALDVMDVAHHFFELCMKHWIVMAHWLCVFFPHWLRQSFKCTVVIPSKDQIEHVEAKTISEQTKNTSDKDETVVFLFFQGVCGVCENEQDLDELKEAIGLQQSKEDLYEIGYVLRLVKIIKQFF